MSEQDELAFLQSLRDRIAELEAYKRRAKRLLSEALNGLDGDNWQSDVEMLLNGTREKHHD